MLPPPEIKAEKRALHEYQMFSKSCQCCLCGKATWGVRNVQFLSVLQHIPDKTCLTCIVASGRFACGLTLAQVIHVLYKYKTSMCL